MWANADSMAPKGATQYAGHSTSVDHVDVMKATQSVSVEYLAAHPEVLPILESWFETEWPTWYGGGEGDAAADLLAYSNLGALPMGLVIYLDDAPCGFAALKSEAISGFEHLAPWAGAAYVLPHLRNCGLGAQLIGALEVVAKGLGYETVYAGTARAGTLLQRLGWRVLSEARHNGEALLIYSKAL